MKCLERSRYQGEPRSTLLTTEEVARIFNVHASTIRRWSRREIIKCCPSVSGLKRRFRREDVAALYLERAIQRYLKS